MTLLGPQHYWITTLSNPLPNDLRVSVLTVFGEVQEVGAIETGTGIKGRGFILRDGTREVFVIGLTEREVKEAAEILFQPAEIHLEIRR